MNKVNNIEEMYELVNPEFLTTKESCLNMLNNVYENKNMLNNYAIQVIKRLAQITNEKVFTQESTYKVQVMDFYVNKDKNNIESCADSLYTIVTEYLDGNDFSDYEEFKE